MLPYLIDDKLEKRKKQPKFTKENVFRGLDMGEALAFDAIFMKICRNGQLFDYTLKYDKELNCRFLHHKDPYLKLGPFKEEHTSERPYVVIFHDILTDTDIDFLIETSTPKLSRNRHVQRDVTDAIAEHEFKDGNKRKVVHKTVQAWMDEVEWPPEYVGDNFTKINYPLLWKLTKRIGLVTNLMTNCQYSSTPMQVTNYGLSGLCEAHIDPHGYLEGAHLPMEREGLINTGDMFGTFMAYLKDCPAGGGTAYLTPRFEGVVMPEKGAAAFWYDLHSNGRRDLLTQHGGCPVLKGSKWILNKWIYYFDNWKKFPCDLAEHASVTPPRPSSYL